MVFQERLFWNIQYKNPTLAWNCACVLRSKILSYLILGDCIAWYFCHPFVTSVLLWVGWVVGQGGVGDGKNPWLGHPWSSNEVHTMVHVILVATEAVGAILGTSIPLN